MPTARTESTEPSTTAVLERLYATGVRRLVYTNVDRDGMLEGPDIEEVRGVAGSTGAEVIYSGGIGDLSDLHQLSQIDGLSGVIVGKALYEERFTVAAAREALGD